MAALQYEEKSGKRNETKLDKNKENASEASLILLKDQKCEIQLPGIGRLNMCRISDCKFDFTFLPRHDFFDREVQVVIGKDDSGWEYVSRDAEEVDFIIERDQIDHSTEVELIFKHRPRIGEYPTWHLQQQYMSERFADFTISFSAEHVEIKAHAVVLTQSPIFRAKIESALGSKDNKFGYVETKYSAVTIRQVVERLYLFRIPEFSELDEALAFFDACIFFAVPAIESVIVPIICKRLERFIIADNLKRCIQFANLHEPVSKPINDLVREYIKTNPEAVARVLGAK